MIRQILSLLCVHFLYPHKKRTKESVWGEALTARPFDAAEIHRLFCPDLEPPSPQTPLPAAVESLTVVDFVIGTKSIFREMLL